MKKFTVLSVLFAAMALLFAGCSGGQAPFTARTYEADAAAVTAIRVDVRDRKIDVSLSDDNKIHLDYCENDREFYDISVSESGVLSMTAASGKTWGDYIGTKPAAENRVITLRLPGESLSSLALSTTNEDISLPALTVSDDVSLSVNGGDITFEKLGVGNSLTLASKNGDINGVVSGGYDDFSISCTTKKGACNLPESKVTGEKALSVTANNGDVSIQFDK